MPTFIWRDTLIVSVGEMSRTQGLDCIRHFDLLTGIATSVDDLMREADILACLYSPVVLKAQGEILMTGDHTVSLGDGETIHLVLPMTREAFMALPMSLTERWISAVVTANDWLVETLKKVLSLALEKTSEPESGSAPSTELTVNSPTTPTTGA